ncbi:MAG: helix-hairpin-helix domain-containing protein [Bacteroidaceae bacterium]|nr:helix-hairpin-helix domain-containing protein [Bacteroidaceae bacterium]
MAIIAIFCVGVMLVVNAFKSKDEPKKASALTENIMPNSIHKEEGVSNSEGESLSEPKASKLFAFDPNTIDSTTLVSFGIKAWKVKNFIHYRKAGKVFHSADDMLDTYGWTEEDIKPLRPYIHVGKAYQKEVYPKISESRKEHDVSATPVIEKESAHKDSLRRYMSNKFKEHTLVDINTADTTLLKRIPGIGSHFARSIVRYRDKLGGFINVEQLAEINNFPMETLDWFSVSTPQIKKININKADFKQMAAHPYIGYDNTKRIKNYVRLDGYIKSVEQLRSLGFFTDEELERLLPYLEGF